MNIHFVIIGRNEAATLTKTLPIILNKFNKSQVTYVDSDSSDLSLNICCEYGINVLSLKRKTHQSLARQLGVYSIKSIPQWIFFLDGDVEPSPKFLDYIARLNGDTSDVILGWKNDVSEHGLSYHSPKKRLISPDFLGGNFVIKYSTFFAVGGWNSLIRVDEERELLARLYKSKASIVHENICLGSHYNWKKDIRSLSQKYFGPRAVEETRTFWYIFFSKNHATLPTYKFLVVNIISILCLFIAILLFNSFAFLSGLFFVSFLISFTFNLYINLNCQPGKLLMLFKLVFVTPRLLLR